jgi:hypothetical protein
MKDNFDLKKFLKENKSLENLNPSLKSINEGEKKQLNENSSLRSKIREMVISELSEEKELKEDEDGVDEAKKHKDEGVTDEPKRLKEFQEKLDDLVEEYHHSMYMIDDVFKGLELIKKATENALELKEDTLEEDTLEEAKEDEEEEITDETDEIETEEETEEVDVESGSGLEDISADMEGTEGELMDHLMSAFKMSKGMDNEKLETQIGNTLKFFVSEFISGEEN